MNKYLSKIIMQKSKVRKSKKEYFQMPIHRIVSHFGMLLNLSCQIKMLFQMKI